MIGLTKQQKHELDKRKHKEAVKRSRRIKAVRDKTRLRNSQWRKICLDRAFYLQEKYGNILCEYSGEIITCLSLVPNDFQEGWGHHIDSNRNNCTPENCYICKYKYHQKIELGNIKVEQEDFQGRLNRD